MSSQPMKAAGWSLQPRCKECGKPSKAPQCVGCAARYEFTGPADSRIAEATPREA